MLSKPELKHDAYQPTTRTAGASRRIKQRAAWLASSELDVERLETKATERLPTGLVQNTRILMVGFGTEQFKDIEFKLRLLNVASITAVKDAGQLQDAVGTRFRITHILVNLDAFDDVESGVEALLTYRPNVRDLIVVACSEMISGDDFGSERAMICDATLKLPVSTPRLANGLVTALMNHSKTQQFLSELS